MNTVSCMNTKTSKKICQTMMHAVPRGIVSIAVVLLSCAGTGPTLDERDAVVMEVYLYAGQPIRNVKLHYLAKAIDDTIIPMEVWNSATFSMDTVDSMVGNTCDRTIDDALVTITNNGKIYELAFRDSGCYDEPGGNLIVQSGETYRIDVTVESRHAWAQTTVPLPVRGLCISRDTIHVDTVGVEIPDVNDTCGKDGCKETEPTEKGTKKRVLIQTPLPDSLMTLTWNNPDHAYIYYTCASDDMTNGCFTSADGLKIIGSTTEEFDCSFSADSITLTRPARYKITLYSTVPEYRSMFQDAVDSTRQDRWIGSPNKIKGGLGIFTSFGIDSIFFTVAPKTTVQ